MRRTASGSSLAALVALKPVLLRSGLDADARAQRGGCRPPPPPLCGTRALLWLSFAAAAFLVAIFMTSCLRAAILRANGGSGTFILFLYKSPGVPPEFICAQQHIAHMGSNDSARLGDDILTHRPQNTRKTGEAPKNNKKENW